MIGHGITILGKLMTKQSEVLRLRKARITLAESTSRESIRVVQAIDLAINTLQYKTDMDEQT